MGRIARPRQKARVQDLYSIIPATADDAPKPRIILRDAWKWRAIRHRRYNFHFAELRRLSHQTLYPEAQQLCNVVRITPGEHQHPELFQLNLPPSVPNTLAGSTAR